MQDWALLGCGWTVRCQESAEFGGRASVRDMPVCTAVTRRPQTRDPKRPKLFGLARMSRAWPVVGFRVLGLGIWVSGFGLLGSGFRISGVGCARSDEARVAIPCDVREV